MAKKLSVTQILASDNPLALDPDFEGNCPCSTLEGDGFTVDVHCWRSNGCGCEFSGIHVSGLPTALAATVAEHVRMHNGWSAHTDWTIVINASVGGTEGAG